MSTARAPVGIGLRQPHHAALLAERPALAFVEVHSENYFADGGAALAMLRLARETYPVSLHGVGLGLGSAVGLDPWHLDRLARLVERIEPVRVSDHVAFARVGGGGGMAAVHANDLLPIPYDETTLGLMVRHVTQVQERLKRPILVENVARYLPIERGPGDAAALAEPAFLTRLCRQSGCGLLLDLNNLMVDALNAGAEEGAAENAVAAALDRCRAFVDALPVDVVGEIHLAGYADVGGRAIDDHGSRVRPAVWALYEAALHRFGARPTLVEWDTDLPALDVLLGEAARAAALAAQCAATFPERATA